MGNSFTSHDSIKHVLRPRLLTCVAGAYLNGKEHCLDLEVARSIIRVTRTNACVIHIPIHLDSGPREGLSIGKLLTAYANRRDVVPLLNTSRATDAAQALDMIDHGLRIFASGLDKLFDQPPLLKLEVFGNDLAVMDDQVLRCLEDLPIALRKRTLPIISPAPEAVAHAIELECPAVRLLSGNIGQATGIVNGAALKLAIAAAEGRPVILEGGIDTPAHVLMCARLGAAGVLVNSAFRLASDPVARARELRHAADTAWDNSALVHESDHVQF